MHLKNITKKTILLPALLALPLCGGTARAEEVTVAATATAYEDLTEGYYVLQAKSCGVTGYLTHTADGGADGVFRIIEETDAPTGEAYIWYVTKTKHGLVLYDCGTHTFLSAVNRKDKASLMEKAAPLYEEGGCRVGVFTGDSYGSAGQALSGGFRLAQRNFGGDTYYLHGENKADDGSYVALGYYPGANVSASNASCASFKAYAVKGYTCDALTEALAVAVENGEETEYKAALAGDNIEEPAEFAAKYDGIVWQGQLCTGTNKTVSRTNCTFETDGTTVLHNYDTKGYYLIRSVDNADGCKRNLSTATAAVGTDGTPATACAIRRADGADYPAAQLFRIEPGTATSTYMITNANTSRHIAPLAAGDYTGVFTSPYTGTAGSCTLTTGGGVEFPAAFGTANDGTSMFALAVDGNLVNAYGGAESDEARNYEGNTSADGGNYWQLVRVTEMPVTITAQAGWASVCLPFAAEIPQVAGLKAYKGTRAVGHTLKLGEISGVVPAGEGFLLAMEGGGSVSLTIRADSDASADTEGNKLLGATARREGFAGGENYFLALDGDGKAAFLQAADSYTSVPCNKAFLPAANIESAAGEAAQTLNFDLGGGEVTGVAGATQSAEERAAAYYDLHGRRVLFPTHGVFVTARGEKVFVR